MLARWRRNVDRRNGPGAAADPALRAVGGDWFRAVVTRAETVHADQHEDLLHLVDALDGSLDAALAGRDQSELASLLGGARDAVAGIVKGGLRRKSREPRRTLLDAATAAADLVILPVHGPYALGRCAMLLALQAVDAAARGYSQMSATKTRQALGLLDDALAEPTATRLVDFLTGLRAEAEFRRADAARLTS